METPSVVVIRRHHQLGDPGHKDCLRPSGEGRGTKAAIFFQEALHGLAGDEEPW